MFALFGGVLFWILGGLGVGFAWVQNFDLGGFYLRLVV